MSVPRPHPYRDESNITRKEETKYVRHDQHHVPREKDIKVIVDEVFLNAHAKQFGITIRMETASIRPGVSFEVAQVQ